MHHGWQNENVGSGMPGMEGQGNTASSATRIRTSLLCCFLGYTQWHKLCTIQEDGYLDPPCRPAPAWKPGSLAEAHVASAAISRGPVQRCTTQPSGTLPVSSGPFKGRLYQTIKPPTKSSGEGQKGQLAARTAVKRDDPIRSDQGVGQFEKLGRAGLIGRAGPASEHERLLDAANRAHGHCSRAFRRGRHQLHWMHKVLIQAMYCIGSLLYLILFK